MKWSPGAQRYFYISLAAIGFVSILTTVFCKLNAYRFAVTRPDPVTGQVYAYDPALPFCPRVDLYVTHRFQLAANSAWWVLLLLAVLALFSLLWAVFGDWWRRHRP
jgi:hypothetical protein